MVFADVQFVQSVAWRVVPRWSPKEVARSVWLTLKFKPERIAQLRPLFRVADPACRTDAPHIAPGAAQRR